MGRSKHIASVLIALVLSILSVCSCFAAEGSEADDTTATDALMTGMSWVTFVNNMSSDDLQYFVDNADSEDVQGYFPGFVNMVGGIQSFISCRDDLGSYVGVKDTTTSSDEENVYADLVLEYEKRDVNVVVGLDRELTQYTKFSFEPVYTFGEKMSSAALNLVVGMVTVFAVLILLMFIIDSFKYVHSFEEKLKNKSKKASGAEKAVAQVAETSEKSQAAPAGGAEDDAQLVAVITAAIAAYEGTSTDGLVVRSIRRARDNKWRRS